MQYFTDIPFGNTDEFSFKSSEEVKKRLDSISEGPKELFLIHAAILFVVLLVGIPSMIFLSGSMFVYATVVTVGLVLFLIVHFVCLTIEAKKYESFTLKRYQEILEYEKSNN